MSRIPINDYSPFVNKRNITPTYSSKEGEFYKQYIKVALPAIPKSNIFALITSYTTIKDIKDEGIYTSHIDFNQDFPDVISKDEVI